MRVTTRTAVLDGESLVFSIDDDGGCSHEPALISTLLVGGRQHVSNEGKKEHNHNQDRGPTTARCMGVCGIPCSNFAFNEEIDEGHQLSVESRGHRSPR